jgi:adenylyl-sulfate kinase
MAARTIWLTGLSGAGKTTLAKYLRYNFSLNTVIIDGDELRKTINADLGFTTEDRDKNITRAAQICKMLNDGGHDVIACIMSPLEKQRRQAKQIIGEENFFLVYVSCDIDTLKARDTKGLYKKYELGEIKNMVGIDLPYEVPDNSNVVVNTAAFSLEKSAELISKAYSKFVQKQYGNGDTRSIQPQRN